MCWPAFTANEDSPALVCDCGAGFVGVRDCHSVENYLRQGQPVLSTRGSFELLASSRAHYELQRSSDSLPAEGHLRVIPFADGNSSAGLRVQAAGAWAEDVCRVVVLEGLQLRASATAVYPQVMLVPSAFSNRLSFPARTVATLLVSDLRTEPVQLTPVSLGLTGMPQASGCGPSNVVYSLQSSKPG